MHVCALDQKYTRILWNRQYRWMICLLWSFVSYLNVSVTWSLLACQGDSIWRLNSLLTIWLQATGFVWWWNRRLLLGIDLRNATFAFALLADHCTHLNMYVSLMQTNLTYDITTAVQSGCYDHCRWFALIQLRGATNSIWNAPFWNTRRVPTFDLSANAKSNS